MTSTRSSSFSSPRTDSPIAQESPAPKDDPFAQIAASYERVVGSHGIYTLDVNHPEHRCKGDMPRFERTASGQHVRCTNYSARYPRPLSPETLRRVAEAEGRAQGSEIERELCEAHEQAVCDRTPLRMVPAIAGTLKLSVDAHLRGVLARAREALPQVSNLRYEVVSSTCKSLGQWSMANILVDMVGVGGTRCISAGGVCPVAFHAGNLHLVSEETLTNTARNCVAWAVQEAQGSGDSATKTFSPNPEVTLWDHVRRDKKPITDEETFLACLDHHVSRPEYLAGPIDVERKTYSDATWAWTVVRLRCGDYRTGAFLPSADGDNFALALPYIQRHAWKIAEDF